MTQTNECDSKCFFIGCQMSFSSQETASIPQILSIPRFSTYQAHCRDSARALALYHWNAQVSAAFIFPIHIYEICVRNAAAHAIEARYGAGWPWSTPFTNSLPNTAPPQYSPRRNLIATRNNNPTAGQVIADLKFAFWESMYTARHKTTIWDTCLLNLFPNMHIGVHNRKSIIRSRIYDVTQNVRFLRNRIAHHEPIFNRNLLNDYSMIHEIISGRCAHTGAWMHRTQNVLNLLVMKP